MSHESDVELAARAARTAGEALLATQQSNERQATRGWWLGEEADADANVVILDVIRTARPDDAILSEESPDDGERSHAARTWIIDPLDGSDGYGRGQGDWAVHIALVVDGRPTAAAVALPALGRLHTTASATLTRPDRDGTAIVVGRSRAFAEGRMIAEALDAELLVCSSAGVKASLVIDGAADAYVHASPMYEWDACAPAAIAESAGLVATDCFGEPLLFNRPDPVVRGLVIARSTMHDQVVDAIHS